MNPLLGFLAVGWLAKRVLSPHTHPLLTDPKIDASYQRWWRDTQPSAPPRRQRRRVI